MENYDWSKFTQRIPIKATIQEIYDYWTTQEGMEKWFLRLSEFYTSEKSLKNPTTPIQKGDTYKWMWHGYSDEVVEYGEILEANGLDLLQFTFAEQCIVTMKIFGESEETIMELSQENIPTDDQSKVRFHLGCSNGWTFYLSNLKSILEGGIDLRNKNDKLKRMVNS
ncbi:SRPBCC domain-containing protein [Flavobacterium sp. GT3R68]|uniref:SRPBCC family protein n=1 Tax=Flavobacterium sp. GT3R68 TaxID=2594437 RepID=UPI000F88E77B|nr:SRPBCC domain-containing protein [Flavobacterium sp. GT3R68]RTY86320.1 SRPBCC domain-containing protein [Flavobacterium sp. GSN2]TRW91568.1 SRPBCC domain-containing protein [Flavobacterium sp. GT3R68]